MSTRDCRICGGAGWTDGSALLRRDGQVGNTRCIGCNGTGKEHGNVGARQGVTRCACGCKYWENDRCIDCGDHVSVG